jgi:hypothetical protein
MDVERIERALREGPMDEPIYVPGTYRRAKSGWSLAVGAAVLTGVLLVGIATGLGLGLLRTPAPGLGAAELVALAAKLQGTWTSAEITRQQFINSEVALGNNVDDVDNLLNHDPFASSIRFELSFADGRLSVSASKDGGPMLEQSGGPYRLLDTGEIYYEDLGCFITVRFAVNAEHLSFQRISTRSCGADERAANSGFFNLLPYSRSGGG